MSARLQLRGEYRSMPPFMLPKLCQFRDKRWRRQARHEYLAGVNADRAELASVIDLDHPVAEAGPGIRRDCDHGAEY